jgi:DNA-directed RNA polymerase subunit RPC12/RpoP
MNMEGKVDHKDYGEVAIYVESEQRRAQCKECGGEVLWHGRRRVAARSSDSVIWAQAGIARFN